MVFNLRSIDLNLLPVFEAAYEARSLSLAASRLAMTQSAVSHALARLRAVFRDELFVRQARGVMPTPVADRIYANLRGALTSVRESVSDARSFEPANSDRRFSISVAHPLGPIIALRLNERLGEVAPGIAVAFSTRSRPVELERGMLEGRVDAAIDWLLPAGRRFRNVTLFEDRMVAVVRDQHPALRRAAPNRNLQKYAYVALRPRVEGEHPVAGLRELQRLDLPVALEVSEILEIFMVANRSDLVGLIPRTMLGVAHANFGLRPLPAWPKLPPVPIMLIWHESREAEPAHVFLREQLERASADVVPRGPRKGARRRRAKST